MKRTVVVVHGSSEMDSLMHALGVFEPEKALAWPYTYALDVSDTDLEKAVENLVRAIQTYGHRVVAAYFPNCADGAYLDKSVTTISNGTQFTSLEEVLSSTGYVGADTCAITTRGEKDI